MAEEKGVGLAHAGGADDKDAALAIAQGQRRADEGVRFEQFGQAGGCRVVMPQPAPAVGIEHARAACPRQPGADGLVVQRDLIVRESEQGTGRIIAEERAGVHDARCRMQYAAQRPDACALVLHDQQATAAVKITAGFFQHRANGLVDAEARIGQLADIAQQRQVAALRDGRAAPVGDHVAERQQEGGAQQQARQFRIRFAEQGGGGEQAGRSQGDARAFLEAPLER